MIRVRFAPSPTGHLHIGNIRTALFNYLFAKQAGGKFVLRMEDTDRERSRQEYQDSQIEDLSWMGIHWDEGPLVGGDYGPYVQSERLDIYRQYIDQLLREEKAYYCYVTEEEVAEMKRLARLERRPPRFDNKGRFFSQMEIEERKQRGIKPTVRFKIENPELKMHDLVRGDVSFNLDDMVGDFVIQRADGTPTFHLSVCVDDALMKITHVIRGEDHLSNTPKHMLLFEAMGFIPPQYGHLSLVHGPGGEPLSKRLDSVSVRKFRERGFLPYALANYIALLGWSPGDNREIFSWDELQKTFDIGRVGRSASLYDPHKLDWLNGEQLRLLSDEEFSRLALAHLKEQKLLKYDETLVHKMLPIFKDNIEHFDQLPERLDFLSEDFSYENPALIESSESHQIFQEALSTLKESEGASLDYQTFVNAVKSKVTAKGKNLFLPLRVAITGKEHGPELKRIFPVFGIAGVRKRLERALKAAELKK